jgi:hypothetical protein
VLFGCETLGCRGCDRLRTLILETCGAGQSCLCGLGYDVGRIGRGLAGTEIFAGMCEVRDGRVVSRQDGCEKAGKVTKLIAAHHPSISADTHMGQQRLACSPGEAGI